MIQNLDQILQYIQQSFNKHSLIAIHLSHYKGTEANLKRINIRKALVKNEYVLSFTYQYATKDIVKNYTLAESIQWIEGLVKVEGFRLIRLLTLDFDIQLSFMKGGRWDLEKTNPSQNALPSMKHDKPKKRIIEASQQLYLKQLNITDQNGQVYKSAQDKYKQINHYIEILSTLLKELPNHEVIQVVDMGCGKGYLTFAIYDYLNHNLKRPSRVVGVELRKDLVDLCNQIAHDSAYTGLQFEQGSIEAFDIPEINVLIALHACDTATDDAIAKGIKAHADLIVVAPCCHKQIRKEIKKNNVSNDLDFLLKHGIFMEREAEMVTDGIRALILEYFGYTTKVIEFISDAHTHKNVMIVAVKNVKKESNQAAIKQKIIDIKSYFGIDHHHLEGILDWK